MEISTRIEATGVVTLAVAGTFNAMGVNDFDRALEDARRLHQPVVVDLSEVRVIDRPSMKHLIDLLQHDVNLVICPQFVEHWIYRESSKEHIE